MKKIHLLLLMLLLVASAGYGQTVAISPTGDGGFESGTTFAANGWTVVNHSNHQWYLGSGAGIYAGSRSAYISQDGGTSNTYNTGLSQTSHFYRDVTIPAGATSITLTFYLKGSGESGWDRLLVYTAPTSVTPTAGNPASSSVALSGATLVYTQASFYGSYTLVTVTLPNTLAGTTVRLIFTWQNDTSIGTMPAAAVDNISLTYTGGCSLPAIGGIFGTCVGGSTTLTNATSGGSWTSSNTSVATINSSGLLTGVSAGSATISYTLGCSVTAAVVIGTPVITGGTTMCVSTPMTQSATPAGGTWSSSTPSVATVNSSSGLITGVAAGTTTITYSIGGSCFSTTVITVTGACYCIPAYATSCAGLAMPTSIASLTGVLSTSITDPSTTCGLTGANYTDRTGTMGVSLYQGSSYTANIGGNAYGSNYQVQLWIDYNDNGTFDSSEKIGGGITTSTASSGANAMTLTIPAAATPGNHRMRIVGNYAACCGGFAYPNIPPCITSSTTYGETRDYMANIVVPCTTPTITGTATVCVGATTTLTSSGTGGSWISSNTSIATVISTGTVSGVSAGTATISYVVSGGCVGTKIITVNPLPNAGAISGPSTMCSGTTATFVDSLGGGSWSTSSAAVATVGSTGIVSAGSPGTVTISYSVTNSCGTTVATKNVTVNPVATITGTPVVCVGATTTLTSSLTGGSWFSGNAAIATVSASGVVSGVSAGTVLISYYSGCLATVMVTVNPLANAGTISGTSTMCNGTTATFTNTVGGGSWSSSSTSVATIGSGGVASAVGAGVTTISYAVTNGCGTTVATKNVTVNPVATITGTPVVCVGATTTLTSSLTGGSWFSGNAAIATVSASGVVTGVSAGTVLISYYSGCLATVMITVNPLPSAGTISGATAVCVGASTTLTSTVGGGSWNSSSTSVATVDASGLVSGVTAGSAMISYTVTNGCGSTTTTSPISVIASPSAGTLSGSSTVCVGATTTLSSTVSGGSWISGNTSIATVSGGVVTGVSAGAVTISYMVTTSCGTATATMAMTVSPLPSAGAISGTSFVCAGSTITLTSTVGGGSWISGNTSVATVGSTGIVTGVSAGSVMISFMVTNACGTNIATTSISVGTAPSAGTITSAGTVCVGSTTSATGSVAGGVWNSSNSSIATISESGIITGVAAGTCIISYSVSNSCGTTTATMAFTVNTIPSAGGLAGATSVCVGATTSLTASVSGGSWTSGDPSTASVTSTGLVSGNAAGSTTITYTVTNECGSSFVTRTMIVNPLPNAGAISGPSVTCANAGATLALTNTVGGGSWSSSNTSVATINAMSGLVSAVSGGTSTISYTVTNACGSSYATYDVTINPLPSVISGASSVCLGSSTTLTSAPTGGSWTSSNSSIASVSSTGDVSGVSSGAATITYMLSTGCYRTKSITVNSLPSAISGSLSVCEGSSTTLAGSTGGVLWSSSNTAVATIGSTSGVVLGLSAGTTDITYTVSTGCQSYAVLTVNPAAGAITGSTSVCVGSAIDLSTSSACGSWTSSNTAVATVGSVPTIVSGSTTTITGVAAGVATITFTTCDGCVTTYNITVNPAPAAITGNIPLCVGSSMTLSSATSGGMWSSSDPMVVDVISVTGVTAGLNVGTSTVAYTTGAGCSVSVVVSVSAAPAAISGPTEMCIGLGFALTCSTSGGTWSSSSTSIATVNASGVVTGVTAGMATISYMLSAGCYVTKDINVNALPGAITGANSVCITLITTLNSITSGGTWSSASPAIGSIDATTGVVTGIAVGTTTMTYMMSTGCYRAMAFTVNPMPTAITGPSTICVGYSVTLTNSTSGGTLWSSTNTAVATIGSSSGVVLGVSAGTTIITYLVSTGGYATLTLTVVPAPAPISGTTTLCSGTTTTLSSTGSGTWSSSFPAAATVNSSTGVVTGIAAGTTVITFTNGSCYETIVVTVNTAATAITGTTSMCTGSSATLSSSPMGGTWSSSNTGVATIGTSGVVTGVTAGTSVISYVVGAAGCATATTVTISAGPSAISGTLAVCAGSMVTLTNATPGGSWTSGTTGVATIGSATGILTGMSAGTANISYTVGACRAISIVSVSAAPAAITGTTNVCVGASVTFTHPTSGGTWASSNTAQATVGIATGVVTGVGAGTPTITYFVTPGCYKTKNITVNGGSLAITGNTNVCQGSTSVLVCTTPGGLTWTSSNPAVATIGSTSGNVTALTVGTTEITYTATSGCTSFTTVSVLVLPTAISGTLTLCQGTTTTLASVGTGGGTWASSVLSKATVGSSTGIVSGIAGGTSNITYTWTNTCKRTAQVTVNPLPVAGAITGAGTMSLTSTPTQTLGASSPGGTWSSSTPAVATIIAGTGFMQAVSLGTVRITYTVTNGCGTAFVTRLFSVVAGRPGSPIVSTGSDAAFSVYPNPTTGVVTIETPVTGTFNVYSIDGRVVSTTIITDAKTTITLSNTLAAGTYMCRFNGDDGSVTAVRLVLESK